MVGISIKFLALGLAYFVALLFQLRVYVKPAAISVFPVFHVLVILLFAFRCFAFLLAVSYSDADGIKVQWRCGNRWRRASACCLTHLLALRLFPIRSLNGRCTTSVVCWALRRTCPSRGT